MPQEEQRKVPTTEQLLANLVGTGEANPGYVAAADQFHKRLNAEAHRTARPASVDDHAR